MPDKIKLRQTAKKDIIAKKDKRCKKCNGQGKVLEKLKRGLIGFGFPVCCYCLGTGKDGGDE